MKSIDETIKDLYPPKNDLIEPDFAFFNCGHMYYKDPNALDNYTKMCYEIGTNQINAANKWKQSHQLNVIWFEKYRLFLSNTIEPGLAVFFTYEHKKKKITLTHINLALFIYFINHDFGIDLKDLVTAKEEIQTIYMNLGKEGSKQLNKELDSSKEHDWFSKLVNRFNSYPRDEFETNRKHKSPRFFGIHIQTRKESQMLRLPCEHDYELITPFNEVYRGPDDFDRFKAEYKKRKPAILNEKKLISPMEEKWNGIIETIKHNGSFEDAIKLGEKFAKRAAEPPSEFEQWWINDNLVRLFVSYETKEYYYVVHGDKESINLPPRQLAVLILFAKHLKDGLSLNRFRTDIVINAQLNQIYSKIKNKDSIINLAPGDSSHPNGVLQDIISRINKHFGYPIINREDGVYHLSGIHEILEF